MLRILLIILTFEDHPVALDRAYQRRIAVNIRMLPFVSGDRHRLDLHVGFGDCGFRFIPARYSDVKPATVPI